MVSCTVNTLIHPDPSVEATVKVSPPEVEADVKITPTQKKRILKTKELQASPYGYLFYRNQWYRIKAISSSGQTIAYHSKDWEEHITPIFQKMIEKYEHLDASQRSPHFSWKHMEDFCIHFNAEGIPRITYATEEKNSAFSSEITRLFQDEVSLLQQVSQRLCFYLVKKKKETIKPPTLKNTDQALSAMEELRTEQTPLSNGTVLTFLDALQQKKHHENIPVFHSFVVKGIKAEDSIQLHHPNFDEIPSNGILNISISDQRLSKSHFSLFESAKHLFKKHIPGNHHLAGLTVDLEKQKIYYYNPDGSSMENNPNAQAACEIVKEKFGLHRATVSSLEENHLTHTYNSGRYVLEFFRQMTEGSRHLDQAAEEFKREFKRLKEEGENANAIEQKGKEILHQIISNEIYPSLENNASGQE